MVVVQRIERKKGNMRVRKRLTGMLICVYRGSGLEVQGEILNVCLEKPVAFQNGIELIVKLDDLFENADNLERLKQVPKPDGDWKKRKPDPVRAFGCIDVIEKNNADFCGMIRWRQSSWKHKTFRSARELLEIIQNKDDVQDTK